MGPYPPSHSASTAAAPQALSAAPQQQGAAAPQRAAVAPVRSAAASGGAFASALRHTAAMSAALHSLGGLAGAALDDALAKAGASLQRAAVAAVSSAAAAGGSAACITLLAVVLWATSAGVVFGGMALHSKLPPGECPFERVRGSGHLRACLLWRMARPAWPAAVPAVIACASRAGGVAACCGYHPYVCRGARALGCLGT